MREVCVKCVTVEPVTSRYLLILETKDGSYYLSIHIGVLEAETIFSHLNSFISPRPMTFDFFTDILSNIKDFSVPRIVIDDFDKGIYKAKVYLKNGDSEKCIDCRPSDAVALATKLGADIFVRESILTDKKCISKDCLKSSEKQLLEQIITDNTTTFWNV